MSNLLVDASDPKLYCPVFIPYVKSRARYVVGYGGRDSSKSYHTAIKIVLEICRSRYAKAVCIRKTYSSLKDSCFDTLWSVIENFGLENYFTYCKAPLEIRCANGNVILARGLDKPAKLKSVKDPTMIWAEEAEELGYQDFIASDMSIRSQYPDSLLQFVLTFNSESLDSWLYTHFFPPKETFERPDGRFNWVQSTQPDTIILHSSYRDNIFCPPERGARYEHLKVTLGEDNHFYRVYALGLFGGALEGLIFPTYEVSESFPNIEDCRYYSYAMDYGYTNDPTACLEVALSGGKIYVQEHLYKTGLVTRYNPITPNLPSIEAELKRIGVQKYPIHTESAEPRTNSELLSAGFNVKPVRKPKGSIAQSIAAINRYPLVIVGGSPNLKKELKSYHYKKDKDGNTTNEPIDAWNHCFVAGTLVTTLRGEVPIESLTNSDLVLTRDGYKPMLWHGQTRTSETYTVELGDRELTGVGSHKIFTTKGKKRLDSLRYGDIVLGQPNNSENLRCQTKRCATTGTTTEGTQKRRVGVTDTTTGEASKTRTGTSTQNSSTGSSTRILLDPSPMGGTSTTETATLQTMLQTISKPCLPEITEDSTLKPSGECALKRSGSTSTESDPSLPRGTSLKRGEHGTLSTGRIAGKVVGQRSTSVNSVRNRSRPSIGELSDSVAINVRQQPDAPAELTTSTLDAKSATSSSDGTSMKSEPSTSAESGSFAVTAEPRLNPQVVPVFNLEIDDPEFKEYYANGVLVGNCLDALRYWALANISGFDSAQGGVSTMPGLW